MKRKRKLDPLQWGDSRCAGMTAAIYVRKSTVTEGRSKSRDEQMLDCERDAERFGFAKVVKYIEEEGQHGEWWWDDGKGHNPLPHRSELTRLVSDMESGEIGAVLVYKQDRLVRDTGVGDALSKIFRKHGVHYICRGRDTEVDTARGLYQVSVDSAAARQWRDSISEEICRDHDYKFKLRMFTRNPSCFGFRSCGRSTQAVRPVYEELSIVRRIYRMFLGIGQTDLGPYQIARVFGKEGVQISTGSKGHKVGDPSVVHGSSIRQILSNPMYAGIWVHNGERAPYERLLVAPEDGIGEPSTVIPEEWFFQAEAKLSAGATMGRKAATSKRLLAGLAICASCGRPLHPNTKNLTTGGKQYRWICPHRTGHPRTCWGENYASLIIDELDAWALTHLAPYLMTEFAAMREEGEGSTMRSDILRLELSLNELKQLETKKLRMALSVLDEDQYAALAQGLKAERSDIEQRLMDARRLVSTQHSNFGNPGDLGSQDPEKTKAAFRRFIRWIAVSDKGVTVLTTLGSYLGATSKVRDMSLYGTTENRRRLQEPTALSVVQCLGWIENPTTFVNGRRHALGLSAQRFTDQELLPGAWAEPQREDDAA